MIKTKGKIKTGNRKNGGSWLIVPDGRHVGGSIHSDLDRHGVPREGREVEIDLDSIAIGLTHGWNLQSGLTRERREELINNDRVIYLATYEG
jgi:hypothetical protein